MTITDPTTTDPTITDPTVLTGLEPVTFDMYRDVHKGIRAELFALTTSAGSLDASDRIGRLELARHVEDVVGLLVSHASHEDAVIQPALEAHAPALAERIEADHAALEARIAAIDALVKESVDAAANQTRFRVHEVYIELAAFTSAYLAHQDVEERVVMPTLERTVGVEAVLGMHAAIIGSIPPAEMAKSLALMLPSMNIDDRTELLGALRQNAPAPVFQGVWSLAGSVLAPTDCAAVAARLGVSTN